MFTGELSSFSREEAVDLAKRYGGYVESFCLLLFSAIQSVRRRVVGQPSSKTNYVVLGDNAGPAKLAAIKKHGLKTMNEDEFLNLIATRKVRPGDIDEKTKKKMEKEQADIVKGAKELEKREKGKAKASDTGRLALVYLGRLLYCIKLTRVVVRSRSKRHLSCGQVGTLHRLSRRSAATKDK